MTSSSKINWFPANLPHISQRFEPFHPRDILRWGTTTFGQDLVIACGFGISGIAMLHMASQLPQKPNVFYLQTDLHFGETLALRDELIARLGLNFIEVRPDLTLADQAEQYEPELWRSNPDQCCQLRKVEPLRRFLQTKAAWVTGIRRDQSHGRAHTPIVSWDDNNHLVKLCPMVNWTRAQVWDYIRQHDLPYNRLHDHGYPSIGCAPCTSKVNPASTDERAGRWLNSSKTECGIHIQNGKVIRRTAESAQVAVSV
jgi:phosphoadenosine phosphosulfate reductase